MPKDSAEETDSNDFDKDFLDQLFGPDSDDDASRKIEEKQSEEIKARIKGSPEQEEEDPLDVQSEPYKLGSTDPDQIRKVTKWHPFMYLYHDCATSMHIEKPRGVRMRKFADNHKAFLECCLVGDYVFVLLCVLIFLAALAYALARVFGLSF